MTTAWDDWGTLIALLTDFKLDETEVTNVTAFFTKAGNDQPSYIADLSDKDFVEGQSGVVWPQGQPNSLKLQAVIRGAIQQVHELRKARKVAADASTAASSQQVHLWRWQQADDSDPLGHQAGARPSKRTRGGSRC